MTSTPVVLHDAPRLHGRSSIHPQSRCLMAGVSNLSHIRSAASKPCLLLVSGACGLSAFEPRNPLHPRLRMALSSLDGGTNPARSMESMLGALEKSGGGEGSLGYLSWVVSVEDLCFPAIRQPTSSRPKTSFYHRPLHTHPKWPKESAK